MIDKFLKRDNPEMFDMKTQWIDIEDSLERELYFKRTCCKVPDPDECELTMSIMCVLLKGNGLDVIGYEGRHIILQDGSKIETDTANSFISIYKGALITLHPNYMDFWTSIILRNHLQKNMKKYTNIEMRYPLINLMWNCMTYLKNLRY